MTTARAQAIAVLRKYGLPSAFVEVLAAEDLESRAAALAAAVQLARVGDHQEHQQAPRSALRWFLPPIRRRSDGVRQTPVGVDVEVGGVLYAGGRYHGPLTDRQVADLEAAGFGSRIFAGEIGSEEASRWEAGLAVEEPESLREALLGPSS